MVDEGRGSEPVSGMLPTLVVWAQRTPSGVGWFESAQRWEELFTGSDNLVAATVYGTVETAPRCCLAAMRVEHERPHVPRH